MTQADKIRLIAERFMGWTLKLPDRWEGETCHTKSGWWIIGKDRQQWIASLDWNPFLYWNDCMMIYEKLHPNGIMTKEDICNEILSPNNL